MTKDFNEVFYKQVLPNISDYIVEFGKMYKASDMTEQYYTVTLIKEAPTATKAKKRKNEEDYSLYKNVIKFVYKRKTDGTIDYVTVGSDYVNHHLVGTAAFEELITILEDMSGVSLFEYITR
jgi:hypothetical protein